MCIRDRYTATKHKYSYCLLNKRVKDIAVAVTTARLNDGRSSYCVAEFAQDRTEPTLPTHLWGNAEVRLSLVR